jgi:peptidoglycan/LPS O-acetylase OafA/YrhL
VSRLVGRVDNDSVRILQRRVKSSVRRPASGGGRLQGVEGLRALAATSILVYHCWLYTSPDGNEVELGFLSRFVLPYLPVGVTLFFTLSGFLLYRPLASSVLHGHPLPSVRRYFRNRALRILPAYWVILLVVGVVLPAALVRVSASELVVGRLVHDPDQVLRSVFLLQHYFPDSVLSGIQPTWSLAIEVVFYLVLPLLGCLAALSARRASTKWGLICAAIVPAAVLFLVPISQKLVFSLLPVGAGPNTGWSGDWHSVVVRSFWSQADLFALGMLLSVLWVALDDGLFRLPSWWRKAVSSILILIVVSTLFLAERGVGIPYENLLAVACALLLALVVLPDRESTMPSVLVRLLETRGVVAVGLASYSLFLWHEPLAHWLRDVGVTMGGVDGFVVNLLLLGTLTGLLSALTYRYIERPALSHKRDNVGPRPIPLPAEDAFVAKTPKDPSQERTAETINTSEPVLRSSAPIQ